MWTWISSRLTMSPALSPPQMPAIWRFAPVEVAAEHAPAATRASRRSALTFCLRHIGVNPHSRHSLLRLSAGHPRFQLILDGLSIANNYQCHFARLQIRLRHLLNLR